MLASKVAPVPPPPSKVRVGADVYPIPPSAIVTDDILPSISLMTGVNIASVVASPVDGDNVGRFLYPKP